MRLIDVDAIPKSAIAFSTDGRFYVAWSDIVKAPTIEATPVVHGRWEDVKETSLYVPDMKYTVQHTAETCSVCNVRSGFIGSKLYLYDNICPNCGAKMDGDGNGEV